MLVSLRRDARCFALPRQWWPGQLGVLHLHLLDPTCALPHSGWLSALPLRAGATACRVDGLRSVFDLVHLWNGWNGV